MLTLQELNRSLLARQGLLERTATPALEMVERLVGMQAQVPNNPYIALWSRIADFDPMELSGHVARREALRAGLMRATVHLVSARDLLAIETLTRPIVAKTFGYFAKGMHGVPVEPVVAAAHELLRERPRTRKQLADALATQFPQADPESLGAAATVHLPLVQIEPRGEWGASMQTTWALTEQHVGPLAPVPVDELMLRYLRAFGPATVGDARTWSRLTGLRPVFERLRPQLRTFRDERGRELFDVPDGLFADPDTPAPPRFLPEYDNLLLSHEDRSRVVRPLGIPWPTGRWIGSLLIDGFGAGTWKLHEGVLTITGPAPDPAVEAEAVALLQLIAPGAEPRVEFRPSC
jgi:hypothetical protein